MSCCELGSILARQALGGNRIGMEETRDHIVEKKSKKD
jgi:hypothetical protein